jgi:N-hydroxyarylamine O-acetyltransferase
MRDEYLERLGVKVDGRSPSPDLLGELQLAHLIRVPFENLDVFHRRGVSTDIEHSLAKILAGGRGGWCFELNGAFGWLLSEVGFEVDYVSCRVHGDDGWGPPLDHCALVVHLEGRRVFVDVGFGDCCIVPIPLERGTHVGLPRTVRCDVDNDGFVIADRQADGSWTDRLWGSFEPLALDAFKPRSDFLQTEPGLGWTTKPFATRATGRDGSRITLRPGVFRRRDACGEFVDNPVEPDQWSALLSAEFGLNDTAVRSESLRLDPDESHVKHGN